jgi:threonine dehydrogenase-like Zn-dependent dehydrogenase
MRAVVMRDGHLDLREVPDVEPTREQLLLEPIAAGVCGGDLNAMDHTEDFLHASRASGTPLFLFDPDRDLVFGHEFTARVVEVGADVDRFGVEYRPGDVLLVSPAVVDAEGVVHCVGYASDYPGALAERCVVAPFGHVRIPDGVSPYEAAAVDPLATGINGVMRSHIESPAGAIVTGCGPVGLGAVAELAARGIAPIVASEPSAERRRIAQAFGAHVAVDPAADDPVAAWYDLAAPDQRLFVYEASGKPGVLDQLLYAAPSFTRITVVGACMVDDAIRPIVGIYKNITIEFCLGMGPDGDEYPFAETYARLADGRIDASQLVTGYASLDAVDEVFAHLRPGNYQDIEHMKILIRHDLDGPGIRAPGAPTT